MSTVAQGTVLFKADRKYEAIKSTELGFSIENKALDIPKGKITFDNKTTFLKEGGKEWLLADMENYPHKVGNEVGTWMALGLLVQDEENNVVQLHEEAGARQGMIYGG